MAKSKITKSGYDSVLYPKPVIAIRVTFLNIGKIIVEQFPLTGSNPPTRQEGQLDRKSPTARFRAGTLEEDFAALMYTFELWTDAYPLQMLEAIGGDNAFILDPVPGLSHPPGPRLDIAPAKEVAFVARKLARRDIVKIKISKPGVTTTITVDKARPCFSVALFLPKDQRGYIEFDVWPGQKKAKKFVHSTKS